MVLDFVLHANWMANRISSSGKILWGKLRLQSLERWSHVALTSTRVTVEGVGVFPLYLAPLNEGRFS